MSNLRLDIKRIPKRKHLLQSFGGEIIVSQELHDEIIRAGLTGVAFRPVEDTVGPVDAHLRLEDFVAGKEILARAKRLGMNARTPEFYWWLNQPTNNELWKAVESEQAERYRRRHKPGRFGQFFQMAIVSQPVALSTKTRFGLDPWDLTDPATELCPFGHNYGSRLLSEVSIVEKTYDGSDFVTSELVVGTKRGLFQPKPILMVSQRAFNILREFGPRSFKYDLVTNELGTYAFDDSGSAGSS